MKIWWNFQFNYSGKPEVLCIKSPKKFYKILAHKIHQAPTDFFSEWMSVAFKFTRNSQNSQKVLFRKDSLTKAEREKIIWHNEKQFIIIKILQTPAK